jgi:hypothetical protein
MAECPAETTRRDPQKSGSVMCVLTGQTLAGEQLKFFILELLDGRIVTIAASLPTSGRNAGSQIVDALREKYGKPAESKPHINSFVWQRGDLVIRFSGYDGMVVVSNIRQVQEQRAKAAAKNKSDL